jgi:uncharacterized protein (DUF1501 family)
MNSASMKRRDFLRRSMYASLAAAASAGLPLRAMGMECRLVDLPRTLVNFMMQGGADLRFLFMPAPNHPDSAYLDLLWPARRVLYEDAYANYEQMFDNEYLLTSDPKSGRAFGIYRRAAWLKEQFDAGNVAVVANAYCSRNRRHDQSILNADVGEPDLEILNFDRAGWGGRLVEYLGNGANSVELGDSVSTFNKGSVRGARLEQVVHAQDMRDIALASPDGNSPATRRNILARALRAYYDVRGQEALAEKPANWPYHLFFQHSSALRVFGEQVEARLEACRPLPDELLNLKLNSAEFAQQSRNLFDVCQVPDALNLGVLSMSYGGWDTHNNEAFEIGANLEDIFGADKGLATALNAVQALPFQEIPASSQLVFYFASDFGRQIMANGSSGTDHGRGSYSILIGEAISGGVYGEMFPAREARPDADGQVPLSTPGADIEGLSSTERILSRAADWVQPGAGAAVFPNAPLSGLEPGVEFATLFSS